MSQIIKVFTGIIMVLLLMVTAMGILGVFLETVNAQNLHAVMIDEIENSHYAKAVLEECFAIADEEGYQLEIRLYPENAEAIICTDSTGLPESTKDINMAAMELRYPIQIAFFELDVEQRIFGYAR